MPRTLPLRRARGARRAAAAVLGVVGLLGTAGCVADAAADGPGGTLAASDPLPSTVPDGTTLVVGDPTTEVALELAGDEIEHEFSFDLEWANLSGGPQTIEAFRAESLDVGAVADIPPIHATWTGVPVSIIATQYRENWQEAPIYELAGRPGIALGSLEDLAGKRVAFSPGQAQGALVLKALAAAGLTQDDVELVELPSTGDVYSTALAAGEVDVAPLGGTQLFRYLTTYEADGAQSVKHGLRDDAGHLYAPKAVLEDPAKAAALDEYVEVWAKARVWIAEHPEEWKQGYYVEHEGLTDEDAQYLTDHAAVPDIPADLTDGIARTQETIDLLAKELDEDPLDAADLFDQRFVAAQTAGVEAQRAAEEVR